MERSVFFLLLMLPSLLSSSVIFHDCGSDYNLQEVRIAGCGRSVPCYLTVGQDIDVTLVFRPHFSSSTLGQEVILTVNHQQQRPSTSPEPCQSTGCPVSGDSTTYINSRFRTPNNIALNTRGSLRWAVYNEASRMVLCYSVVIQTQTPLMRIMRQYALIN